MKCYYQASYREPVSADLVYAKLKQQFPGIEMHISETDYPHTVQRTTPSTDMELGSDVSFAILAPLTNNNYNPSEQITNNSSGITPPAFGAIHSFWKHNDAPRDSSAKAVIYGSCESNMQPAITENLRRYGADSILVSRNPF